jgi:hypothetical protein
MADDKKPKHGLHIRILESGDVALDIFDRGNRIAGLKCSPHDVSVIVAKLILAANDSASRVPKQVGPPKHFSLPNLPLSDFSLVSGQSTDERTLVLHVGEVELKFAVPHDELRGLSRFFGKEWIAFSSQKGPSVLGNIVSDFFINLGTWYRVARARLTMYSRRRVTAACVSWTLGRSLRIFRIVEITDGVTVPRYEPVKKCIYCGEDVYSHVGARISPLGDEHIIAEGLGGTLELPEASCQRCEQATGGIVEGDVLGRTLKALRMYLKLRKKGKSTGSLPKTLPLVVPMNGGEQRVEVAIEDYPIILNFPVFGPPRIGGPGGTARTVYGFVLVSMQDKPQELFDKYKIERFASAPWDSFMLCRMLAKIGHSFAAAELQCERFDPLLADLIRNGNAAASDLIGGDPDSRISKSNALHELGLGYQRINKKTYVVARIRLFARQGGPVYFVIVGESLESPLARVKRRLSRWFLLIFRRY